MRTMFSTSRPRTAAFLVLIVCGAAYIFYAANVQPVSVNRGVSDFGPPEPAVPISESVPVVSAASDDSAATTETVSEFEDHLSLEIGGGQTVHEQTFLEQWWYWLQGLWQRRGAPAGTFP